MGIISEIDPSALRPNSAYTQLINFLGQTNATTIDNDIFDSSDANDYHDGADR